MNQRERNDTNQCKRAKRNGDINKTQQKRNEPAEPARKKRHESVKKKRNEPARKKRNEYINKT